MSVNVVRPQTAAAGPAAGSEAEAPGVGSAEIGDVLRELVSSVADQAVRPAQPEGAAAGSHGSSSAPEAPSEGEELGVGAAPAAQAAPTRKSGRERPARVPERERSTRHSGRERQTSRQKASSPRASERPDEPAEAEVPDKGGESRPTAAIPMENPYCSCKLTRVQPRAGRLEQFLPGGGEAADSGQPTVAAATAEAGADVGAQVGAGEAQSRWEDSHLKRCIQEFKEAVTKDSNTLLSLCRHTLETIGGCMDRTIGAASDGDSASAITTLLDLHQMEVAYGAGPLPPHCSLFLAELYFDQCVGPPPSPTAGERSTRTAVYLKRCHNLIADILLAGAGAAESSASSQGVDRTLAARLLWLRARIAADVQEEEAFRLYTECAGVFKIEGSDEGSVEGSVTLANCRHDRVISKETVLAKLQAMEQNLHDLEVSPPASSP